MLPTGFRTFHFVSFLYVFFFSFLFLLFRFFSHYFFFVFLRFVFLRFFSFLFSLFSFRFFSFRFFSFLFVFFRFSVYRYPKKKQQQQNALIHCLREFFFLLFTLLEKNVSIHFSSPSYATGNRLWATEKKNIFNKVSFSPLLSLLIPSSVFQFWVV